MFLYHLKHLKRSTTKNVKVTMHRRRFDLTAVAKKFSNCIFVGRKYVQYVEYIE